MFIKKKIVLFSLLFVFSVAYSNGINTTAQNNNIPVESSSLETPSDPIFHTVVTSTGCIDGPFGGSITVTTRYYILGILVNTEVVIRHCVPMDIDMLLDH